MEGFTELTYHVMSLTLCLSIGCFFSPSVCKMCVNRPVKIVLYVVFLVGTLLWAEDFIEMKNTPRFDVGESSELQLLELKYAYAKLQRDVYFKFILAFTTLAVLCTSRAWERTNNLIIKLEHKRS